MVKSSIEKWIISCWKQAGRDSVRETQPMPELRIEDQEVQDPTPVSATPQAAPQEELPRSSFETIAADQDSAGLTGLNEELRGPSAPKKGPLARLIGRLFGR